MRVNRARAEAEADERARLLGYDAAAIRRSCKILSAVSNVLILAASTGLAVTIWTTRNMFDLPKLLAAVLFGLALVLLLTIAGGLAAHTLTRESAMAAVLAVVGAMGVAGYFGAFVILGWRFEAVLGLVVGAVVSVVTVWSTPSAALTALRRDKPSLSSVLDKIARALPDWQTGLSGRVRALVVYGLLFVLGQLAEVAGVFFVPSAVGLIAVLAGVVSAAVYLLRRRVALVLSVAAAYPVVLVALTVTLS